MDHKTVVVFYDENSIRSSQYTRVLQGIRSAAGRCAVPVRTVSDKQFPETDPESLPAVCIAMGADMPFLKKVITVLREHGRHVLLAGCDSEPFGHGVSCATPSRRTETQQLINYLYSCGRSRLALVGFGANSINDTFRYHAALTAVTTWGDILKEENIFLWRNSPMESIDRFLEHYRDYDAVVCPNDMISVCLIKFCKEKGIRVPEDLFVASFGNMAVGICCTPSITSMTMDMPCVGEQAFYGWRFLLNNDSRGDTALKISVPSKLMIRESTACMHSEKLFNLPIASSLETDRFYEDAMISKLVQIDRCIEGCDEINYRMLEQIMDGKSYEQIADELFISGSTIRYRLNRIFDTVGVHTRQDLEKLLHSYLGEENPFRRRS